MCISLKLKAAKKQMKVVVSANSSVAVLLAPGTSNHYGLSFSEIKKFKKSQLFNFL
jgi:hypothetical protein